MAVIDASGNYIVIQQAGKDDVYCPKKHTRYNENADSFSVIDEKKSNFLVTILFDDAADWDDIAGDAYNETTLRTFLRGNTGS